MYHHTWYIYIVSYIAIVYTFLNITGAIDITLCGSSCYIVKQYVGLYLLFKSKI